MRVGGYGLRVGGLFGFCGFGINGTNDIADFYRIAFGGNDMQGSGLFGIDFESGFFALQFGNYLIPVYPLPFPFMPFYKGYLCNTFTYNRNFYFYCH